MCGFAGVFSPSRVLTAGEIDAAHRVAKRQSHRGPDAAGQKIGPHLALFHQKLSITTGAEDSAQPFSRDAITCVFVGEIYNHRDLARRLGAQLSVFDGDILPRGFAREGHDFLGRLNGEFAAILLREGTREITMTRDRAGARSLFFTELRAGCWLFSTELAALVADPLVKPMIDEAALLDQLVLQEWKPRVGTFFKNVYQVPPGSTLTLGDGMNYCTPFSFCSSIKRVALSEAFANAVVDRTQHSPSRRGCVAFSGGLDSTSILVASREPAKAVDAFTVVASLDDPVSGRVRDLAQEMPWVRSEFVLLPDHEITDLGLTVLTRQLAAPICDTTPFALSALFRTISSQGFRYCLSGEGADDFWGGYALEASFLNTASIASAYQSIIDRTLQNGLIAFASGRIQRTPVIKEGAADAVLASLNAQIETLRKGLDLQRSRAPCALTTLSVLGPLRRSLEQADCLAGLYGLETRLPFCSAELITQLGPVSITGKKEWIRDSLSDSFAQTVDWTKRSFATRRFADTRLAQDIDSIIDEIRETPAIMNNLSAECDDTVLRQLASVDSKLWWSMVGIARFCSHYR